MGDAALPYATSHRLRDVDNAFTPLGRLLATRSR